MKPLTDLRKSLLLSRVIGTMNVLRIANAVKAAETLTFGGTVWECTIDGTLTAPTNIPVNVSAAASLLAAARVATFSGNAVADETISMGGVTYTWKASPAAANQVLVGADAAASIQNLIKAVNLTGTAGVEYGTGTVINPQVSATGDATTFTATAKVKGTAGNSIVIAEAMTNVAWASGATALTGGADASAADFTTALAAASMPGFAVTRISANEVLFEDVGAQRGTDKTCSETLTGTNNAWAAATSYGGAGQRESIPDLAIVKRVPNAQEVTLGNMHFNFAFAPSAVIVQVRVTSGGAAKAWGGTVAISGRRVTLGNNTTNDFAATDTVTILATE